jgi:hypothetical protein
MDHGEFEQANLHCSGDHGTIQIGRPAKQFLMAVSRPWSG